jgi:glycosyltransferase involved in cell wall biosynthesis
VDTKFSLVLATVGRTEELGRCLRALDAQTYRNFELIVVDQNPDDRLAPILEEYECRFTLRHLRSERGLSRARNVGLRHLAGEVIAFPDDDCWYPTGLLEAVAVKLACRPEWDGLTTRVADADGASFGRFAARSGGLNLYNVWATAVSVGIFLRRKVVDRVGYFDETLGAGAGTPFGSGEEADYVIRAIRAGFGIHYLPQLVVHHPNPQARADAPTLSKTYAYGRGMGRVLRKHGYPAWYKARAVVRPLGGALLSLAHLALPEAALRLSRGRGRLRGLWE